MKAESDSLQLQTKTDSARTLETKYTELEKAQRLIVGPLKTTQILTLIIIDALDECKDEEPASAILLILSQSGINSLYTEILGHAYCDMGPGNSGLGSRESGEMQC